ncbi:MAG: ribbon-helix-helix protein, CopG family [Deltaproteobacteria bacterium]|jgi:predicted DNA-binding ribbon-helix-helix protein|nr:MAG: ribbon-helix-helix protein, CopG family [Deltaproteobacteria bacterium]
MPLTKKAMVLFEPEKYRQLKEIARKEHISVGEIIRKAIDEMVLKRSTEDERLEAAKRLTAPKEDFMEWAEIEEIIARAHGG